MALPCPKGAPGPYGADGERLLPCEGKIFPPCGGARLACWRPKTYFALGLLGALGLAVTFRPGAPMPSYPQTAQPPDFSLISRSFAFREGARFTGLIGPDFFQGIADEHGAHFGAGKGDTYNAPVTCWAWLSQALSPRKSCLAAACRVLVLC